MSVHTTKHRAAGILGVVVVATVVLGRAFEGALGARTVDAMGTWWFQWWAQQALAGETGFARTDLLFFPWGKELWTHTGGNLVDVLLMAPVRALLGPVAAWNTLYVLALASNAAAAAWVARGAGRAGAWAAAAFTLVHPFVLHELAEGRPTQALLAPVILALGLADRCEEGDRRSAVACGAWLALAGWIYWYAAGFAAMAIALRCLGRPFLARLRWLVTAGLASIVLTGPLLFPLALALARGEVPGLLADEGYLTAEGGVVRLGTLALDGRAGFLGDRGWVAEGTAFGLVSAAMVLATPRRWWPVAALALAIAVAPLPGGFDNPVPRWLAAVFPPFERLYWPVRAVCLLVPVGVIGLVRLSASSMRASVGVAALAVGEALYRGWVPLGTWTPTLPAMVTCLARHEGAMVVLPYGYDQHPLLFQAASGRPMFNGMHERSPSLVPEEQQRFRKENSWMAAVIRSGADPRAEPPWTEADKAAVGELGYRWLVVRADALKEPGGRSRLRAVRSRLTMLAGPPVYADEQGLVYAPFGDSFSCD